MTITGFTYATSEDVPLQRFEVFTGTGRRRDWSDEEKDRIVAESYSGEMSVSAVARRYGLSPGQLFTWRRQVRSQAEQDTPPMFVPAVIDRPGEPPPMPNNFRGRSGSASRLHSGFERHLGIMIDPITQLTSRTAFYIFPISNDSYSRSRRRSNLSSISPDAKETNEKITKYDRLR
jgi:hypothetical protein